MGRAVRIVFGVAGLSFLIIAFLETWDRSKGAPLPDWRSLLGAGVLMAAGLWSASRSWRSLFQGSGLGPSLARGFYAAQLGKYIPGAIWQAVGQIGFASRTGIPLSAASTAFVVHALTQLVGAATVAFGIAVLGTEVPPGLRLSALLGLLTLLLLRRAWMVAVVDMLRRRVPRARVGDVVPSQSAILASYGWSLVTMLFAASAFVFLISSRGTVASPVMTVSAFALAWAIGFVAIPFPAGVGIREAILVAVIGGTAGTAAVIATSVVHRLVNIVVELVVIGASRVQRDEARRQGEKIDEMAE